MELISSSPKYEVFDEGESILKVPKTEAAVADLARSAVWSQEIGGMVGGDSSLVIPDADILADGNVRFEKVLGRGAGEEDLPELILLVADVLGVLTKLKVEWEGSADEWYAKRVAVGLPEELGNNLGSLVIPKLTVGVVHGDFAPKNMILTADGRLALIDAEFGTYPARPEYAMPRMHDGAYLYHLLVCQYQNQDLAGVFLDALQEKGIVDELSLGEFWASVMERTLSMYRNFVQFPKEGFEVDECRKDPEPYLSLLSSCVEALYEVD